MTFSVELYPRMKEKFFGHLTFHTNDPSDSQVRVPVKGRSVNTGTVVMYDAIEETLFEGEQNTRVMTLANCHPDDRIIINGSATSLSLPEQDNDRILRPENSPWLFSTLPPFSITLDPGNSIQFNLVVETGNRGTGDYYGELVIECFAPLYYSKGIKPILLHIVQDPVNLSPVREAEMQVFPNPTRGEVTLETGSPGTWMISVFNLNGQVVFETILNGESGHFDLSGLGKGLYLIHIRSEERRRVLRLMIL